MCVYMLSNIMVIYVWNECVHVEEYRGNVCIKCACTCWVISWSCMYQMCEHMFSNMIVMHVMYLYKCRNILEDRVCWCMWCVWERDERKRECVCVMFWESETVCVYVYVRVIICGVCARVDVYVCGYSSVRVVVTHTLKWTFSHTYTRIQTRTHSLSQAQTHTHAHAHTHTHTHTQKHTHTHAHTQTHIQTHTHTHTYARHTHTITQSHNHAHDIHMRTHEHNTH